MSFKMSNAYFPNIIKIYETTDQVMKENGLLEFLDEIIQIMTESATRFEYKLDESKTYIVSTIEFPSEDEHNACRAILDNILATVEYEIPVSFVIKTHLF